MLCHEYARSSAQGLENQVFPFSFLIRGAAYPKSLWTTAIAPLLQAGAPYAAVVACGTGAAARARAMFYSSDSALARISADWLGKDGRALALSVLEVCATGR